MKRQVRTGLQRFVRQRAHGQRDPFSHNSRHQRRILHRPVAVIDTLYLKQIDGLCHVRRGSFLTSVGNRHETLMSGGREDAGEVGRRMIFFGGIESDAENILLASAGLFQRVECLFLR